MARVLIVEDDADQLELRRLILEAAGHQVATASDWRAALERGLECEVAVVDLIPHSSEILNGLPESTRVILLTGREVESGSVRADRILVKPCPSAKLLAVIAELSTKA